MELNRQDAKTQRKMSIIISTKMRFTILAILLLLACGGVARGEDLLDRSIPRKWITPVLPEDLPDLEYPSWANDLDKARLESFAGRYKKSLYTLLKTKDADAVEVALIRGTSLDALGRHDEALAALLLDDPRVKIHRADILSEIGRNDEAIAQLKDVLQKHPDSILAHYQIGFVYERIGDLNAARDAYGWFVVDPQNFLEKWQKNKGKGFDNAEELTSIGRAIDRWATLTGSYQNL